MTNETVTLVLALLVFAGPILTTVITLWFQSRREKLRHAHELRRDQTAKYFAFGLDEYREYRDACGLLIAAARQWSVYSTARGQALEASKKPATPQNHGALQAEVTTMDRSRELAADYVEQAFRLLRTDTDAAVVVTAYQSLPMGALLDAPEDKDVRRRWNEGLAKLQEATFDYLQAKRAKLLPGGVA